MGARERTSVHPWYHMREADMLDASRRAFSHTECRRGKGVQMSRMDLSIMPRILVRPVGQHGAMSLSVLLNAGRLESQDAQRPVDQIRGQRHHSRKSMERLNSGDDRIEYASGNDKGEIWGSSSALCRSVNDIGLSRGVLAWLEVRASSKAAFETGVKAKRAGERTSYVMACQME
ncbi:hypothetical protein ANO11243_001910 [Dothideomycetidae sp. 11243]|nr:hypothetical protein ANO11243_001910 [fungal sp. No.11243]